MVVAGCDVGALTAKAVVMKNDTILGFEIIRTRAKAVQSAADVMDKLLNKLDLSYEDIDYCVSTGYGRNIIPFAHDDVSEISCHGRGAKWLVPTIRTIIDGGGQDCKAIRVDENGIVEDFRMNTKCAAGTGRSLELMAEGLGVDVSQLGPLSLEASDPVVLQEPCCIITEIEIRHLILEGRDSADIAAGISDITARRILHLARNLGVKKDVGLTGGIAKNVGVVDCLERALKMKLVEFPEDPQVIGAIGAAVFAADRARKLAQGKTD
jgi:predicted CoA-substrate-specific enzyme activase